MTDPHLVFTAGRLSVQCEDCHSWPESPHVIGLKSYCPACCPECNPVGERSEP